MLGNTLLALFFVGIMGVGNRLEYCPGGSYTCPSYCEIDHIHYQEDCNETKKEKEAYEQRIADSNPGNTVQADGDSITTQRTY